MANIKSSQKRIEIARRNQARNRQNRSEIKTIIKRFETAIAEENKESAADYLKLAEKRIRQAESKSLIHKNKASRKIGQLTRQFNEAF